MQTSAVFGTLTDMIVDGKAIAEDIRRRLMTEAKNRGRLLTLGVIALEHSPEAQQYLAIKKKFGQSIRVNVEVITLPALHEDDEHLFHEIIHASKHFDGIVLQLPLPRKFNTEQVLSLFPLPLDVDVIGATAYKQFEEDALPFLPPVVGAFVEILHQQKYILGGKNVVVVGAGRLVGAPAAVWARQLGANVTTANSTTVDLASLTRSADVIILGAGSPGLLKADMVKQGVIVLDAGTSEDGGVVRGDADPAVAEKASVFTPTPGGVGPIAVAKLFENLLVLDALKHKQPLV